MKCLVNAQMLPENVAKEYFAVLVQQWLVRTVSEWGGAMLCHTAHGVSESLRAHRTVFQQFMVQPRFR